MLKSYWKFLQNSAKVLAPLTNTPKGLSKFLLLSPKLNSALILAKKLLASVPIFTHPEPGVPVSLAIDASHSHVGTVLQQKIRGSWSSLARALGCLLCCLSFLFSAGREAVYPVHGPQVSDKRPVQVLFAMVSPAAAPSSLHLYVQKTLWLMPS